MKKSLIYWQLILCNQDISLYNTKAGIHFAVSDGIAVVRVTVDSIIKSLILKHHKCSFKQC